MKGITKEAPKRISYGYSSPRRMIGILMFMIFGLVFVGIGIYVLLPTDYEKNGIQTTATIQTLDGGERNYPTVKFEVNGVSYEGEILVYESTMEVGGTIEIRYMKDNPNDFAVAKGQSIFSYFYVVVGAVFVIASLSILISYSKKSLKRINKIKQNGTLIRCCLVDFTTGNSVEGGTTRYLAPRSCTITCKDSNGYYYNQKFFVADVAFDYTKANFGYKFGDSINVYISNDNPKKFAIDVIEYQERKVMEKYNDQNGNDNSAFEM